LTISILFFGAKLEGASGAAIAGFEEEGPEGCEGWAESTAASKTWVSGKSVRYR
jgi:hypothetical protein